MITQKEKKKLLADFILLKLKGLIFYRDIECAGFNNIRYNVYSKNKENFKIGDMAFYERISDRHVFYKIIKNTFYIEELKLLWKPEDE